MFSDRIVADYNMAELFKILIFIHFISILVYRALMINVLISPIIYYVIVKLKDKALPVIVVFWFFDVIYYPILMFAVGSCFAIGDYDLNFKEYRNKGYLFGIGYLLSIILKMILIYMPQIPNHEYILLLSENQ